MLRGMQPRILLTDATDPRIPTLDRAYERQDYVCAVCKRAWASWWGPEKRIGAPAKTFWAAQLQCSCESGADSKAGAPWT